MVVTDLGTLRPADAVILAVAHDRYACREGGWPLIQRLLKDEEGLVLDVKMKLDRGTQAGRRRTVVALSANPENRCPIMRY